MEECEYEGFSIVPRWRCFGFVLRLCSLCVSSFLIFCTLYDFREISDDTLQQTQTATKLYHTFGYVVVHFGDVPAEYVARVVGHDQTILYERPSEVAPHAPAIRADLRASGKRLLYPSQQQKRLNLIRNCLNSILQALRRKELEKGTEVDARTAELYSEHGNTDITELAVICAVRKIQ